MDRDAFIILLNDSDRKFRGGHHWSSLERIAQMAPPDVQRLRPVCPVCYGRLAVEIAQNFNGPQTCDVWHLGTDYRCLQTPDSKQWLPSIPELPNTFTEFPIVGLPTEPDLVDSKIDAFRRVLVEAEPKRLISSVDVKQLVHCINQHGPEVEKLPFYLLGSNATNWENLQCEIHETNRVCPNDGDRRIFYGQVDSASPATGGVEVFFDSPLGARSIICSLPIDIHSRLANELYRAKEQLPVNLFVLGSLKEDSQGRSRIRALSPRHFCVTVDDRLYEP